MESGRRPLPSYLQSHSSNNDESRISVDSSSFNSFYSERLQQRKPTLKSILLLIMKNKFAIFISTAIIFALGSIIMVFRSTAINKVHSGGSGNAFSPAEADFLGLKLSIPSTSHPDYDPTSLAWDNGRNYGIVIDAGSSGSRIYVYSWLDPSFSSPSSTLDSTIKIEKADALGSNFELKEEPGVSSFSNDPKGVGPHLEPLLAFASKSIPVAKQASTPVYLFATAGMRLVEPGPQKEILKEACKYVKNRYTYYVNDCDTHFRVISGELEGIFGWLTVNYLKTRFKDNTSNDASASSYGFIDMGGASAQIAFEPTAKMSTVHSDDVKNVAIRKLNGKDHTKKVFVTTFLGYGANQARERYIEMYTTGQTSFTDPCLNSGLEFPSGSISIAGAGDFEQCLTKVNPLLNLDRKCAEDPCLFNGIHAPIDDFKNHHFLGVSELWYTTNQAYGLGGVYNYEKLHAASQKLCSTTWSDISNGLQEKKYPDVDSLSRMKLKCFKSAYLLSVLHDGLKMPKISSSTSNSAMLETIDDLDGYSVTWTLGAALLLASSQIKSSSIPQLSHRWTSVLLVLLVALAAAFYYFVSRSRSPAPYTDLSRFHNNDLESDNSGGRSRLGEHRKDDSWSWK